MRRSTSRSDWIEVRYSTVPSVEPASVTYTTLGVRVWARMLSMQRFRLSRRLYVPRTIESLASAAIRGETPNNRCSGDGTRVPEHQLGEPRHAERGRPDMQPGRPASGVRGSQGGEPLLQVADDRDDLALDPELVRIDEDRLHRGVRGLESDPVALSVQPLQGRGAARRRLLAHQQRYHDVAVLGRLLGTNHHQVAVVDQILDHRLALDLERVAAVRHRPDAHLQEIVVLLHRLDRLTSGNPPHDRDPDGGRSGGRHLPDHAEPARDFAVAADQPAPFERPQVVVDHRRRRDADRLPDLADARRIAVVGGVLHHELKNLLLPFGHFAHHAHPLADAPPWL